MPLLGEIALSRKLYFKPADPGADIYDVLQDLKQSATADKNKIRFFIVTDFQNIAAYDTKADDYLECAYTDSEIVVLEMRMCGWQSSFF